MISFTNTLSGKKEEFKSIEPKKVGMYNCGPTVYDYAHIGNLRKYVFDDVLRRVLEFNGYKVHQVINVTDVGHIVADADLGEDKIEKGAKREGKTVQEITHLYASAFFEDLKKLNVEATANEKDTTDQSKFPWATKHIQEQLDLIKILEAKGYTYTTSDGVYFDTSKFKDYGKLGNIDIEGLREGARVESNNEKRNPTDFALWKLSKPEEKRLQEWPSPWGLGFPGWHIECSAMSMKYLGETFDIHTGGIDHIPVHHNNEIAQSEAATGKKFVNYWLHEAFVNVDGGKMAKSLNNFYRLSDLEKEGISPLAYRYWLLIAHYRSPVNFTWEAIRGAQNTYNHLFDNFLKLDSGNGTPSKEYVEKFSEYIGDDLDTPRAVALMWELIKDKNVGAPDKRSTLLEFDKIFAFDLDAISESVKIYPEPEEIMKMREEREIARKNKDYKRSDELRIQIQKAGFEVKDMKK